MGKSFTYKFIEDGGNRKVLFLNSAEQEITRHFIRNNDAGKECFDIINPYINYDNLTQIKKYDMELSIDNIGDCIQAVIDGYGDKMFVRALSSSFFAVEVVKYLDEDFGKQEREEVLEEYKNIEWKYSIKLVTRYNRSHVVQKDGLSYITNLVDDSDKAVTFDSREEAEAALKELSEAVEYHVGNRLASFKKARRWDIISDNDPDNILKIALLNSDMTGTELDKRYELKIIQIMV